MLQNKDSFIRTAILVLLYFLFLYTFQIPGFPFGTLIPVLGVLALVAVFSIWSGSNNIKSDTSKMMIRYCCWNVFLIVYVSLLLMSFGSGNGTTPIQDYLYMIVILPIFYLSGIYIFEDVEDLMRVLYIGVIIQTIIILVALMIPSLSLALFLFIPEGGYNSDSFGGTNMIDQFGYHIGLGVFTSAGSLKMAIGQIGALYYLIKSKGGKLSVHLIIFLLITVATSLVSRTGLLVSVVGFLIVFFVKSKQKGSRAIGYISSFIVLLVIGYITVIHFFSSDFLEDTFHRFTDTAENGLYDSYFRGYTGEGGDNTIPPISFETLIGLGITYGVSGSGIQTITDGGIMRNYSAMGLIVAVINYIIIASFFVKRYRVCKTYDDKGLILFMASVLLIGEFKEYYIYYISPMCFFFLVFSLLEKVEKHFW